MQLPSLTDRMIRLRGVKVHNLHHLDLDLPHGRLIAICGPSGSGKTSLALDTLYAEGQRRYIETFSAYTRQFLEQLEKPAADRIEGIPPAIAVAGKVASRSNRATVGTVTELIEYLQLLFAKVGQVICTQCGNEVRRDTPESAAEPLLQLDEGTRLLIAFPAETDDGETVTSLFARLREAGYVRAVVGQALVALDDSPPAERTANQPDPEPPIDAAVDAPIDVPIDVPIDAPIQVIVDRLVAGRTRRERLVESLETAMDEGQGRCLVATECDPPAAAAGSEPADSPPGTPAAGRTLQIDGRAWRWLELSNRLECKECGLKYAEPDPRLLSFNSPLGACPQCEGFGNVVDVDMDLVVPDGNKSLRDGAIAPWNTPAYAHELDELLALAPDFGIPVDVPFRELSPEHLEKIHQGVPERKFGGLRGFFAWLERRKYKMHLRVFLSRFCSDRPCSICHGARLRSEALAVKVAGKSIADVVTMRIDDAVEFFRGLKFADWQRTVSRVMLDQVHARLAYLQAVGVGYLTLDRTLRTLSSGETQRVALTSALGSTLAGVLYVLDEPSAGLHLHDIGRVTTALIQLRDRGNTVVVVEHVQAILGAADQVIELGPGAGEEGGRLVFLGTPAEMLASESSVTGPWICGRRGTAGTAPQRRPPRGWIRLSGARGHNLKNITVEFPLGVLCLVTGVSGAGKSTLVEETLYPALAKRLHMTPPKPCPYDDVIGDGQIDHVVLIDQSPVGRSARSNPVTYLKAFDEIRALFADTVEARTNNFGPGHFSFNVDGGRCESCRGDGHLCIDMQFLADVYMTCVQCRGRRYRQEILDVQYRGRSIADVLEMTVREAITFFRGHSKVRARLKPLVDVGLDYVRLGQPANTLSAGEAQRLKLAAYLAATRRGRTLFVMNQPTTGLHFGDVIKLLDCFDSLLSVGHSLIVIEHSLQLIQAADYLVDIGPGAGDEGGQVVAQGTPEQLSQEKESITGQYLRKAASDKFSKGMTKR